MSYQKCDDLLVWGVECMGCFKCRCRTFRDWDYFVVWLLEREFVVRGAWRRVFTGNKNKITVYWCEKMPKRYVCTAPNLRSRTEDRCWYHDGEVEA
jgi:hypothetical protein